MPDFNGRHCAYTGFDEDYIEFLKEVDPWDIAPLRYAVPQGVEISIKGKEVAFFDSDILCDVNLSHLELRLMMGLCCYTYPLQFMDLCTLEGVQGYVISGLDDIYQVRDMILSLRDRGYLSIEIVKN